MSWFQAEVFSDPLQAVTLLVIFMSQRHFHITHSSCTQKANREPNTMRDKTIHHSSINKSDYSVESVKNDKIRDKVHPVTGHEGPEGM